MTLQFSNTVLYRGQDYTIAGVCGNGLFDPADEDSAYLIFSAGYWNGHPGKFEVESGVLVYKQPSSDSKPTEFGSFHEPQHNALTLQTDPLRSATPLHVVARTDDLVDQPSLGEPLIDASVNLQTGALNCLETSGHIHRHLIRFSGGLLLGDGFLRDSYPHLGCHPAYKFQKIHELIFEGGELTSECDRSQEVEDLRQLFRGQLRRHLGQSEREEIEELVQCCFQFRY